MSYRNWHCEDCGHEVLAETKPAPIRWTDGHTCRFVYEAFDTEFEAAKPATKTAAKPKRKAKATKMDLECMECGRKFRSSSMEPKCPKCGSYDIELA